MIVPSNYSFPRYLAAKKSVDDRALNRRVWETLAQSLPAASPAPLRVLEVGAGIGTMLERLLESGLLLPAYDYCLKCSHTFNVLDARGAISVSERARMIQRVRSLACKVAALYLKSQGEVLDVASVGALLT